MPNIQSVVPTPLPGPAPDRKSSSCPAVPHPKPAIKGDEVVRTAGVALGTIAAGTAVAAAMATGAGEVAAGVAAGAEGLEAIGAAAAARAVAGRAAAAIGEHATAIGSAVRTGATTALRSGGK